MLINRLRLVNFRQHEDTELAFGAGLTGIVGPNGAGKTTLLEAIAWAMYGMPAARGSRDTIRRRGAPTRAKVEVELDFTLGPHHYHVVRSLQSAELYQDGQPAPIANSLAAVTERIQRLLGMTRDEFFNTYFTGQKELAVMAAMSPADRAQFLSRVLGYERLRTAQDRLREQRSTLKAKLDALRGSLPDPAELDGEEARAVARLAAAKSAERTAREALAAAESALAEVRPRWETMERLRETAVRLERELQVARVQAQAARERLDAREREAADAAAAATQLAALRERLAPLAALRAEHTELERQAEAAAARQGQLTQLEAARQQLGTLDARLVMLPAADAVDEARRRVNTVRAELAAVTIEATERRAAWVRDAQEADTKRLGLLDQYQELKEQRQAIVQAGRDGACPTCARPLHDEFEKVLGVLDRQLEEVTRNGTFYKQRIEQLRDEPADLQEVDRRQLAGAREETEAIAQLSRLDALSQQRQAAQEERDRLTRRLSELERAVGETIAAYDQARHTEVRRLLRELEPIQLQAERLRDLAERAAPLAADVAALREVAAKAMAAADRLAAELSAAGYSESAYRDTREAAERADRARRDAELASVRARAEHDAAVEAHAAVGRRREERLAREREAKETATDLALRQELDRALGDLRTDLNASLRPELSELASGFLRDLTNGRYTDLELDESYTPTLLDDGDPKAVISGGEEDVANLALRLAISQMIAERAGQPLSLLILDEIFGSLDEDRRIAVMNLLRSLADRFPQVVLITHIDSVREGFDRVVRVGLDVGRGVAVVRDEQPGGHDVAA